LTVNTQNRSNWAIFRGHIPSTDSSEDEGLNEALKYTPIGSSLGSYSFNDDTERPILDKLRAWS